MQNLGGATYTVNANTAPFVKGMQQVHAQAKQTAQGMLQLGYAIDDLQYGFRSIVNNIPQLVLGMGGTAGLAGAVAIAAVAVNQLVNNWGTLTDQFQSAWLNVPASHLEKLRIAAEKAGDAFERLTKMPKDFDAMEIKALEHAITEAGTGGVIKGLGEAWSNEPGNRVKMTQDQKKQMERAAFIETHGQPAGAVAIRQRVAKELEDANTKAREEFVKNLMGGAMLAGEEGQGNRATLRRLVNKYKNSFTEKFVNAIFKGSPEMLEEAIRNGPREFVGPEFNRIAVDRGVAAMMMKGPLGRRAMMDQGGGEGERPATVDAARAMAMIKANPLLRRLNPRAREDLAKHLVGMSPDQAAGVMAKMGPGAVEANAKDRMAGRIGPGAADLMQQLAKDAKAAGPGAAKAGGAGALEKDIQAAMDAAGVPGDAKGVLREMRQMNEDAVQQVMMETGATRAQAQRQVMRENIRRAGGAGTQGGHFMDAAGFAKFTQSGILRGDQVPNQQLAELKKMREILDKIQQQDLKDRAAVAVK